MNIRKMRHQRERVHPTVRPAEVAAHPTDKWQWQSKAILLDGGGVAVVCEHCGHRSPCPTKAYLHGQEGHNGLCGGPDGCDLFAEASYAREHELV